MSRLTTVVAFTTASLAAAPALAGTVAVPGPLAGAAFGPAGLIVAGGAYVAYRLLRNRSK